MADTKITGLTEATEIAGDDLLVFVDKSDTTMAASGTTKGIQRSAALSNNLATTDIWEDIGAPVVVTDGSFSWSSLTLTGYDEVMITGKIRGKAALNVVNRVLMYLNGDNTASNYLAATQTTASGGPGGDHTADAVINWQTTPAANSPTGSFGPITVRIPDPAGSDVKNWVCESGGYRQAGTIVAVSENYGSHDTLTSAITSITIQADSGNLEGTLQLKGRKSATIGGVTSPGDAGTEAYMWVPVGQPQDFSSGTVTFDNIPQDGRRLRIVGRTRNEYAGQNALQYEFNDDSTVTNYPRQEEGSRGNGAASDAFAALLGTTTAATNAYGTFDIWIDGYASSTGNTQFFSNWSLNTNSTSISQGQTTGYWNNTSPVTKVHLKSQNAGTCSGSIELFVERRVVVTPGKHLIRTVDNMSSAGVFDFSSISYPSNAAALIIEGIVRSTAALTVEDTNIYFNSDTSETNYRERYVFNGSSAVFSSSARCLQVVAGSSTANDYSHVKIRIAFPGRTDVGKGAWSQFVNNDLGLTNIGEWSTRWASTNAITDILIRNDSYATTPCNGILKLYFEY